MRLLNLADWIECTQVEGPGKRFALWVQGCAIRCPGCCNPHMHAFELSQVVSSSDVAAWVSSAQVRHGIEGVTFLGGEPMLQAQSLAEVAQAARSFGLTVMVFTGYAIEELHTKTLPGATALLASTDILVDGRFERDRPENRRNWAGSTNQRFHFLTRRYSPGIEYDCSFPRGMEFRITSKTITLNGQPIQFQV